MAQESEHCQIYTAEMHGNFSYTNDYTLGCPHPTPNPYANVPNPVEYLVKAWQDGYDKQRKQMEEYDKENS